MKQDSRLPTGLGNWDNSCYQNSTLQALSAVPSVRTFIDEVHASLSSASDSTTTEALREMLSNLNDTAGSGYIWTPIKLKSMSSWQQQDAQEYYSKLVDQVEMDLATALKPRLAIEQTMSLSPACTKSIVSACASRSSLKNWYNVVSEHGATRPLTTTDQEASKPTNPFEGLLAQRVGCTRCGHSEGLSLIPFNCITLPLGEAWSNNICECLDNYTSLEYIEGVECAMCTLLQTRDGLQRDLKTLGADVVEGERPNGSLLKEQEEIEERLQAINDALQQEDLSETTLLNKCHISSRARATTTKTRQAIVMQMPKCLVLHVNRSLFDETTGEQRKNYTDVGYDKVLDVSPWCVGKRRAKDLKDSDGGLEEWEMNPSKSMIPRQKCFHQKTKCAYELKALVIHQGRHEDGHYICYRQLLPLEKGAREDYANQPPPKAGSEQWWRISDEDVLAVEEEEALSQGAAFMLFYERLEGASEGQTLDPESDTEQVYTAPVELHVQHEAEDAKENEVPPVEHLSETSSQPDLASIKLDDDQPTNDDTSVPSETAATVSPYSLPNDEDELARQSKSNSASTTGDRKEARSVSAETSATTRVLSPIAMRTAGVVQRDTEDENTSFASMPLLATT
ncbi:MAG: hypothetical protein M1828_006030 [Chrysothrix sp. TS-e1954]|nr:MAG: hypothetical protein M1828_006030 [Chrysothrix sp. TS-e1954]